MDEHELYGVPREQFIAERAAWAKALRAEGLRDDAARVAALRKPSVAAWTVNRLVRTEPDRFAALLKAGDALRTAQDRMLSGDGTADELRDAVEHERAAVGALLSSATDEMSPSVSDRVAGTLHAAALDLDARGEVSSGRLVEELQHVGFGGEPLAAGRAPKRPPAKRTDASEREQAEERRLAEERAQARRSEREARHRLEAAERVLADAEHRHASAQAALDEAEEKLDAAQADVRSASDAHDAAQRALDSL
jgi:hypothetical protein